jgi:carboxypeptidase Taq
MTDPNNTQSDYRLLGQKLANIALLQSTSALLEWDQQTKLPTGANQYRSQQITYLAGELHRLRTDPKLGEAIEGAAQAFDGDPHSEMGCNIANARRDYLRQIKLPTQLVEELAQACSQGHQIWVDARRDNDFQKFAPALTRIIQLKQEQADAIGFEDCRYDALLDEFEPGAKTSKVAEVLEALRVDLVPLVDAIGSSSQNLPIDILHRHYPVEAQEKFVLEASAKIGFEYNRGRLDVTHHPFCTEIGPNDCRITTRYDETFFSSAFFGTLHEAGHGIYEQGLPQTHYGLAAGQYCSLGIHESQSRMWENLVGRSRSFWQYFFPIAAKQFPAALRDCSADQFYAAVNHVEPSLIRVEADEATYNLHIIIRFELEQMLIDGVLAVEDLPDAWNEKYQQSLGVAPDNFSDGVLQDVHWSAGLMGYFPTYSLGNLYASQLFSAAQNELGDLDSMFAAGEFGPLKNWLNTNIHAHGKRYCSGELCQLATGTPLSQSHLISDLTEKLSALYKL